MTMSELNQLGGRVVGERMKVGPADVESVGARRMTVVGVADIDVHLEQAVRATLFGMREYIAFDHEHHLWCFQEPDPAGG
ncbi:hypothetical protein [Kribbella sp. HUAS MG21]|uniref:Uncharacterized protein n=1 Tax=Kribbella sp. HUAS MG21 TaxID=3160966 RepID=A0AAU7TDG3_9ACTN